MPPPARLTEAMRIVAADDTPAHRVDLYEALLAADLLVLTPDAPAATGPAELAQDTAVELVTMVDDETGGVVLPVFSSEQAILRFGQTVGGFLAMPGRALFEMADGAGVASVAVDHGSPTHGVLGPAEVAALARGHVPTEGGEIVQAATEVLIGVPSEPLAPDVAAAVRAAVAAERHADAAWLFLLQQPPADPQLVVAVALDEALDDDARAAAMRGIVTRAGEETPRAQALGFIAADTEWRNRLDSGAGLELYRR